MTLPSVTDELLQELLYRGEGSTVDYKAEQYVFSIDDLPAGGFVDEASRRRRFEEKKSELLKDILAMANTWREETAYILLGFRERESGQVPEVVGLLPGTEHDDAAFQQFVEQKVNRPISFRYEVRAFRDKTVGVISIAVQSRPFFAKSGYGKVIANTCYLRRGSSTVVADLDEVARMGEARVVRKPAPIVRAFLTNGQGAPFVDATPLLRTSMSFGQSRLPDFSLRTQGLESYLVRANTSYWRELAQFVTNQQLAVELKIRLENDSPFPLTSIEVHLSALQENKNLDLYGPLGSTPQKIFDLGIRAGLVNFDPVFAEERCVVADFPGEPSAQYKLNQLLPGANWYASKSVFINPISAGTLAVKAVLYSVELPKPLSFGCTVEIDLQRVEKDFEFLKQLAS